jgi:hypothetical protein
MEPHWTPFRLAAMSNRTRRTSLALLLPAVLLTLAACAGGAGPSPSPSPAPIGTPKPTPTAVPGDPGSGNTGGGTDPGSGSGGGGTGGNPGTGIGIPFPGGGSDPNIDPLFGNANYVTPGADLVGPHPVNVQLVRALQQEDGTVIVDLRWWSGVAPCYQLDHVEIAKDETAMTIRFTVIEGSGKGDIACIDIAQLNATTVDMGKLAAGEWKLSAEGDAPPITLTVK